MIRLFSNDYSVKELIKLRYCIAEIMNLIECNESECGVCEYRHLCLDIAQLHKRVEHLEAEAEARK